MPGGSRARAISMTAGSCWGVRILVTTTSSASAVVMPPRSVAECPRRREPAPLCRSGSVLLVVEELGVDRQQAPLALLLQLHHAVDRREDAVAEQLLAAVAQG